MAIGEILIKHCDKIEKYFKELSGFLMVVTDKSLNILEFNRGFKNLLNLSESPAGNNLKEYLLPESYQALSLPGGEEYLESRLNFKGHNSPAYVISCHIFNVEEGFIFFGERPVITSDDIVARMSILNEELTNLSRELNKKNIALERANATITRLSRTDAMTGLPNRGYFMEVLKKNFSYSNRQQVPLSIIMADLDYFKSVNDTYGHQVGDQVLISFARLLQEESREEDLPARFGGEEFIILLPHTVLEEAVAMAERIRKKLEGREMPSTGVTVTASLGVVQLEEGDTMDSLLKRVDEALYRAKEEGRNQVVKG